MSSALITVTRYAARFTEDVPGLGLVTIELPDVDGAVPSETLSHLVAQAYEVLTYLTATIPADTAAAPPAPIAVEAMKPPPTVVPSAPERSQSATSAGLDPSSCAWALLTALAPRSDCAPHRESRSPHRCRVGAHQPHPRPWRRDPGHGPRCGAASQDPVRPGQGACRCRRMALNG